MAKILLGVCGGISAYKSCELVREFQRQGHEVRVIMTKSAQEFVTKLTFESLTRAPVHTDLFGDGAFGTAHIETARWADLFVVAPLTANTLANFVTGKADDFLSTVYLAYKGFIVAAPAMNTMMWQHDAVQKNLRTLAQRGVRLVDPVEGELACGEVGVGKMAEPVSIAQTCERLLKQSRSLQGVRVLLTAGPTREYLDPVRFISSPSTGKMGVAMAREAAERGAEVTVIQGPTHEPIDFPATLVPVISAEEMAQEVLKRIPADVFVGTAAVSDYRPQKTSNTKIKKGAEELNVHFVRTTDILTSVSRKRRPSDLVVGFAAETDDVVSYARKKLQAKNLDLVVANKVFREKEGFVQNRTTVTLIDHAGEVTFENLSKRDVATHVWNRITEILEQRRKSLESRSHNKRITRSPARRARAQA